MQITKLGLWFENIHICVNRCVLFCKNHATDVECQKIKEARYRLELKLNSVSIKVLCNFPLVPRFL